MTLAYAAIQADDPRVGLVVADLRERQRRELEASGERSSWREIGAEITALARAPNAPAYRLWLVEDDGAPVAVVIFAFASHSDVQAGLLATRAWEAGVPRGFWRWLRRHALAWLDGLNVRAAAIEVWISSDDRSGRALDWLMRLGFKIVHVDLEVGPTGWAQIVLVRRHPRLTARQAA